MNFHGYSGCYKRKITSYLTIKRIETDRNITQNIGKSQSKKICIEIQNSFLLNGSFSGFRIIGFHNYLRKAEFCQRNPVGAACRRFHLKPKIAVRCTGFYYIRFVRRSFCIRQITQRRQQSGLDLIIILSIKSIAAQNIHLFGIVFIVIVTTNIREQESGQSILFTQVDHNIVRERRRTAP